MRQDKVRGGSVRARRCRAHERCAKVEAKRGGECVPVTVALARVRLFSFSNSAFELTSSKGLRISLAASWEADADEGGRRHVRIWMMSGTHLRY